MSDPSLRHATLGWSTRLQRLPPAAIDLALTALALAGQAAPFAFTERHDGGPWTLTELLPVLVVALPVLGRRFAPIRCLLLSAAGIAAYAVVGSDGPQQPVWYAR